MFKLEVYAEAIAIKMKSINNEGTASIEVLKYGLLVFINIFSIVLASAVVGLITGKLMETLLVIIAFAVLRALTGGSHLKSSIQCIVVSTILVTTIPHIPINDNVTRILTIISILLIVVFAPLGIENQTNIPRRYYPLLKVVAISLVAINLFVLSGTLAGCFLIQSILLIKWNGGEKYEKNSTA